MSRGDGMWQDGVEASGDYNPTAAACAQRVPAEEAQMRRTSACLWPMLLLFVAAPLSFAILYPVDQAIADWVGQHQLGGDLRRELEAWQQYGAIGSIFFAAAVVWQLDRARRVRLWDLALAVGLVGAAVIGLKVLIGRARPVFVTETGQPGLFVPAWRTFPYPPGGPDLASNWETGARLWSMPSSHTAYAALLSVFLICLYPRFKWIGAGMVALVGGCRVLFGAHYPSDVTVGVCVAVGVAWPTISGSWGVRLRNTIWDYLVLPTWGWARSVARLGGDGRRPLNEPEPSTEGPAAPSSESEEVPHEARSSSPKAHTIPALQPERCPRG